MSRDLFGIEMVEPPLTKRGKAKPKANGYAARPGSGPAGETCRSCVNAVSRRGGRRYFWKCALVTPTHGLGTDIRLRSPACAYWKSARGEK